MELCADENDDSTEAIGGSGLMHKILITGGAGFVGRHFCRTFLERGDQVHCVDSVEPFTGGIDPVNGWPLYNPNDYPNFHFHKEDCRQYFQRVADTDFDYAFHLAAMVGGREMIENNPLAVADDLSIDSAYWQWARRTMPAKTICFSVPVPPTQSSYSEKIIIAL